ncbi:styrene monooxygenase/indole monooxygenase family protein [Oceanobacter mangrovi]|uniref:styrene monooxygenase/indole monooxygenase family protein n=1 Tax=Oceanobacter mangrovi TaxID=2862510 RepID=UPI001C8E13A3|nr:styrene monooxygenase/indole monooxygenase family protein [Oceanobacter mangrovi]
MRRIAIVGAGQSGLQLGIGLLDQGYQVTIVTNRTADEIRNGRVMSSQCMFETALQTERDLGIDFWKESCPPVEGISVNVMNPERPGSSLFSWAARLDGNGQSVDQRVKMPLWIETFVAKGGKLIIEDVGIEELERLASEYELVLLAAGKGDIVRCFERDAEKSAFDKPQRALALTYVQGMEPSEDFSRVAFNLIPGVGEYFAFPALTTSGPCHIMVFEGIPGGPMDCWQDAKTPAEHLQMSLDIINKYAPSEAKRCANVTLTDDGGYLAGRFAPTIRHPVMTLPSGKEIFGMADALVVSDPITGQGSNNAAKCTALYMKAILGRGEQPFDRAWMQQTFDAYWDYAKHVVAWTNTMLTPPPAHILQLLATASKRPDIASRIVNGFDDPRTFAPWWFDADACAELMNSDTAEVC